VGGFGVTRLRATLVVRCAAVVLVALLLAAFTAVYRFNTLGGTFGGFDNDHFVSFAYAKEVQAGARPLRDYDDLGLQGAWPPLAFVVSALGQAWLGNTLRSEAIVTIGSLAVAAAATFVAAALVAPVGWAALATALTIFVAPTLYNFPKVLVFGVAVLLIAIYARRPGRGRVAWLAALTAVAFLMRHDYAVYIGTGVMAALMATAVAIDLRSALRLALTYAIVVTVLLTPSLIYVQRYSGLVSHIGDNLAMSRAEGRRTPLAWPRFTAVAADGRPLALSRFLGVEQNAGAWLYYLILFLPLLTATLLWRTRAHPPGGGAVIALVAVSAMLALASQLLLRGNVIVRFGDIGPLYAFVLAGALGLSTRRAAFEGVPTWLVRVALAVVVLGITLAAGWTAAVASHQLEASGLSVSRTMVSLRAREVWALLGSLPQAYWTDPQTARMRAVQYLNHCTAPTDRIVMMPYEPDLLPLAERRFGAGRPNIQPGQMTTPAHQQEIVRRWSEQSVPLAIVEDAPTYERVYREGVPVIDAYLNHRYALAGELRLSPARALQVFAERGRTPGGTFGDTGLPCFGQAGATKQLE
jgi:hypothetical protein